MGAQAMHRAPHGAQASARPLGVSVVICAYATRRWDALIAAVDSVAAQTRAAEQTIVVIDHNPAMLEQALARFSDLTVVANAGARGLSGARNTGVASAHGEIVAFLDDDAVARPDWLHSLLDCYDDQGVVGAGGIVEPRWQDGVVCQWLPAEFYWTIGCSYRGLPEEVSPIRNPIGANMSFRRDAILAAGGFREGIGRLDTTPLGCEETEMAVRVTRAFPGSRILHAPRARVDHLVEADRSCWRYFRARCWSEGLSKAIVARHVGQTDGLASERSYALKTLPLGFASAVADALRGEPSAIARGAAILAGLAITAAGYLWGRVKRSAGGLLEGEA
jgi:GT2 family glycosyltransferase